MIEIEKNVDLTKEKEEKFLKGADFLGIKVFTDVYYDTKDYYLTKQDIWFRARDGKFEIKVAIEDGGDKYEEVENESRIKEILKITNKSDLKDLLEKNNYFPFIICKTTRRKYKKEGFNIDIDFAEFEGGFTFEQAEVELMIEDESKAEDAAKRIINFITPYGLHEVNVGKISEYLKNKRPDHYNTLKSLGFWPEN